MASGVVPFALVSTRCRPGSASSTRRLAVMVPSGAAAAFSSIEARSRRQAGSENFSLETARLIPWAGGSGNATAGGGAGVLGGVVESAGGGGDPVEGCGCACALGDVSAGVAGRDGAAAGRVGDTAAACNC